MTPFPSPPPPPPPPPKKNPTATHLTHTHTMTCAQAHHKIQYKWNSQYILCKNEANLTHTTYTDTDNTTSSNAGKQQTNKQNKNLSIPKHKVLRWQVFSNWLHIVHAYFCREPRCSEVSPSTLTMCRKWKNSTVFKHYGQAQVQTAIRKEIPSCAKKQDLHKAKNKI